MKGFISISWATLAVLSAPELGIGATYDGPPPRVQGNKPTTPTTPMQVPHNLALPPGVEVPEKTLGQALDQEFSETTQWLSRLRKRFGTGNTEATAMLDSIQGSAVFLRDRWHVWLKDHPKEASKFVRPNRDSYWFSLYLNNQMLSAAVSAGKSKTDTALKLVREVDADMQVKADHARKSRDGLGQTVLVKAHTQHDAQEVSGYEVWYVQKGMLDNKNFHTRFARLSTPTEERGLCPGRYVMWSRKAKNDGEPATISVPSRPGNPSEDVDLEVPNPIRADAS